MKIMIDTNILISAALFKGSAITELMNNIFDYHQLVLSSSIIEETRDVIQYKFPNRIKDIDAFFASISFEYQHTANLKLDDIQIRDFDDRHVIASALLHK